MWDDRYSEQGFAYGDEPNTFLAQNASKLDVGKTLCIAEGQGRNAVHLAQIGHDVTAMDQSEAGLKKAQDLAERREVDIKTVAGDLSTFDLGRNQWDTIVSIFGHLPSALRRDVNARVVEALKPGGLFVLEAYREEQLETSGTGGPTASMRDFFVSEQSLHDELASLEFEHIESLVRIVDEGAYHSGEGAVVQLIARKPKEEK